MTDRAWLCALLACRACPCLACRGGTSWQMRGRGNFRCGRCRATRVSRQRCAWWVAALQASALPGWTQGKHGRRDENARLAGHFLRQLHSPGRRRVSSRACCRCLGQHRRHFPHPTAACPAAVPLNNPLHDPIRAPEEVPLALHATSPEKLVGCAGCAAGNRNCRHHSRCSWFPCNCSLAHVSGPAWDRLCCLHQTSAHSPARLARPCPFTAQLGEDPAQRRAAAHAPHARALCLGAEAPAWRRVGQRAAAGASPAVPHTLCSALAVPALIPVLCSVAGAQL